MKRFVKKINTREDFVLDNISDKHIKFITDVTQSKLHWFHSMKNHPGLLQIDKKNGIFKLTNFGSQPANLLYSQNVFTHKIPAPITSLKNPPNNLMQPVLRLKLH